MSVTQESGAASSQAAAKLASLESRDGPPVISAEEFLTLKHDLEALAEDLAEDPHVVECHSSKLQILDIAAQAFGRLAEKTPR